MSFECELCGHEEDTLDLIKEHMLSNHEEEFYSAYFDIWAEDCIVETEED